MSAVSIGNKSISVPVIQGGMGIGVSLGNLAGHVAANGGMGVISAANTGFNEPDFYKNGCEATRRALKAEIKKAKEIASGRGMVGVNVMMALCDAEELIRISALEGADAVIVGAGLPLNLPALVEGTPAAIAPIVSSAKAAALICRSWLKHYGRLPDFVVVEGSEAGGHLGFSNEELEAHTAQPLEQIVSEVIAAVEPFAKKQDTQIPVFGGGGVYTAEDIKRLLTLGAAGAQIATRFIATEECDASLEYKKAYLEAKQDDILIVKSPVGMPGRALRSPLTRRLERGGNAPVTACVKCLHPCNPAKTPYCITGALTAAVRGDRENGLFFCGSNAYRMDKIITVKELMGELTEGIV